MDSSEAIRILSVEDNPETRMVLKHQLRNEYELVFASGVAEALRLVENEDFDLFLLDINLGAGKSGTDLLHAIRSRDDVSQIPAIALTAYAMPGDREDLLASGFDAYLGKPFSQTELNEMIDETLSTK